MIAPTVLPIVGLLALKSRCARSLSVSDTIITHVSPSIAEIHKTAVVWSDASYFQDSARGNRRKNSIQTP
jgi:hypothetical protein